MSKAEDYYKHGAWVHFNVAYYDSQGNIMRLERQVLKNDGNYHDTKLIGEFDENCGGYIP
jgi:hypothetical protein